MSLSKIPLYSLFVPPKFCISISFIFSWDHIKSQEKMERMFMQNFGGSNKEDNGIFESGLFFFLRRSNQENNLGSLHTNWWSRNFLIVSRWRTGKVIAIKLKTLCQHRSNTSFKKQLFRFTMYHWREGWKHLNSRNTPQLCYGIKTQSKQTDFCFS